MQCDYDLNVMGPDQCLSDTTATILTRLDQIVRTEEPDWLLVQGDTTTAMAASMVAYYHRIPVGHVEAGLRTYDKWRPYPEEMNRRIADLVADLHFAPTARSRENLLQEGFRDDSVIVTGNTVVDALMTIAEMIRNDGDQPSWCADGKRVVLLTAHRRENFGPPLESICEAVSAIAARYRETVRIVYPVHSNPNVRGPVYRLLGGIPNVVLTEPLGYREFVHLMMQSHVILTDSGGLQEEAPSLRVPVLVLREVTERPEGVAAGVVDVVGTTATRIVAAVTSLLEDECRYRQMASGVNPYGDGHASERIVMALRKRHVARVNHRSASRLTEERS